MTYDEFLKILKLLKDCKISCKEGYDKILSLMDGNTEGVSNDSRTESGVSHGVSDRNASRSDSTKDSESFVGGTLALRTDTKEQFQCCICDKKFDSEEVYRIHMRYVDCDEIVVVS